MSILGLHAQEKIHIYLEYYVSLITEGVVYIVEYVKRIAAKGLLIAA